MGKLYAIFFSATDTTRKCVASVCKGFDRKPDITINLADGFDVDFPDISSEDIVIAAAPVYGGRLPVNVAETFARLKGNNAMAIVMAVYGNRDYDDALLELTDILHENGFRIAGVGAFIGQHAIFPKVAVSRPDQSDEQSLMAFGKKCKEVVHAGFNSQNVPYIKGTRPYKKAAGAPLYPKAAKSDCVKCGKCVSVCPVNAIPNDKPYSSDTTRCISCGRCITVCSKSARRYSGMTYSVVGLLFRALCSKRKEPEWIVAE